MKVVINNCHGAFSLSEEAYNELGIKWDGKGYGFERELEGEVRTNPRLVACIEKLGEKAANSWGAELVIVEIPDDVQWHICEYDGKEEIHENHRIWSADGYSHSCRQE